MTAGYDAARHIHHANYCGGGCKMWGVLRFLGDTASITSALLALVVTGSVVVAGPQPFVLFWPVVTGFLMVLALIASAQWRKARYSEAMRHIAKAYDDCVDTTRRNISNQQRIREAASTVCTELSEAFSRVTGANCEVCIKRLVIPEAHQESLAPPVAASTFARSDLSSNRPLETTEGEHLITGNSDFLEIFEAVEAGRVLRVFSANALPFLKNYVNTSFPQYGGNPRNVPIPGLRVIVRYFTWKLPYRSAIVAPIIASHLAEKDRQVLVGYLCVDSRSMFVFRRADQSLLEGVAVALHPMVYKVVDESIRTARRQEGTA